MRHEEKPRPARPRSIPQTPEEVAARERSIVAWNALAAAPREPAPPLVCPACGMPFEVVEEPEEEEEEDDPEPLERGAGLTA